LVCAVGTEVSTGGIVCENEVGPYAGVEPLAGWNKFAALNTGACAGVSGCVGSVLKLNAPLIPTGASSANGMWEMSKPYLMLCAPWKMLKVSATSQWLSIPSSP